MTDFDESFWPEPVQTGHAGRHHGVGTPECPTDLHHHHDEKCEPERDESKTVDGFTVASCRTCYAPIVWANTLNGERMPVDAEIVADGNVVLSDGPRGSVTATVLDQASLFADGPRRKAHFATCPDAAGWRRR